MTVKLISIIILAVLVVLVVQMNRKVNKMTALASSLDLSQKTLLEKLQKAQSSLEEFEKKNQDKK